MSRKNQLAEKENQLAEKENQIKNMVTAMSVSGMSIETIADATELSPAAIEMILSKK